MYVVLISRATDVVICAHISPREAGVIPLTAVVDWKTELVWWWIVTKTFYRYCLLAFGQLNILRLRVTFISIISIFPSLALKSGVSELALTIHQETVSRGRGCCLGVDSRAFRLWTKDEAPVCSFTSANPRTLATRKQPCPMINEYIILDSESM